MTTALSPVTLVGTHVVLEPLRHDHHAGLVDAVRDGELWKLWYTSVPAPDEMSAEIDRRLRPPSTEPAPVHTYPPGFAHVSPEAIEAVLDVWDAHDDGVEGWFVAAGGSSAAIDQLRRTLLA